MSSEKTKDKKGYKASIVTTVNPGKEEAWISDHSQEKKKDGYVIIARKGRSMGMRS